MALTELEVAEQKLAATCEICGDDESVDQVLKSWNNWRAADKLARGRKWAMWAVPVLSVLTLALVLFMFFVQEWASLISCVTIVSFFVCWQLFAFYDRGLIFLENKKAEFWRDLAGALLVKCNREKNDDA